MTVLCKFMQDPSLDAYNAARGLLLYVHNTKHKFIHFDGSTIPQDGLAKYSDKITNNAGFIAYSDASWRDPHKFGWNMFGYVCYMYGAPVAFASSVNIHTSSVNIHTSAHSPVCVRSCSCNVRCVEACLWMSSTMVHSFTPPSVNIHTHSVNIHTPAH